ncbi:MAG: SCO family protein, partial [Planctomycetes bacterium]|nr:SCO family protein [Planctomycetota bacterium]
MSLTTPVKSVWATVPIAALILISSISVGQSTVPPVTDFPQSKQEFVRGGSFNLLNHLGEEVSDRDFRGRLLLIYFGYTYCPEICPTDLAVLSQTMTRLGDSGENVQPLFITLDPRRDTVD